MVKKFQNLNPKKGAKLSSAALFTLDGKYSFDFCLGNVNLVRMLIDHGAEICARDVEGLTPLHYAAMWGKYIWALILTPSQYKSCEFDPFPIIQVELMSLNFSLKPALKLPLNKTMEERHLIGQL